MKDQEYNYFYKNDNDKKYCYPGTNVLKNKLNIRDLDILCNAERDYSAVRQAELDLKGVTGDFSIKHLCSIHNQLFQDIYTWAGKIRTVDISKGTIFCMVQFIETQFDELYNKLKKENNLANITDKNYFASFEIDFTEVTQEEMLNASIHSAKFNNDLLEKLILKCLIEI